MTLWVFLVPLSSTGIYDSLHIDNKAGHEFTESGTQQHTETRGEVKDQSLPQEQKGVFHCYLSFPPAECPTPHLHLPSWGRTTRASIKESKWLVRKSSFINALRKTVGRHKNLSIAYNDKITVKIIGVERRNKEVSKRKG